MEVDLPTSEKYAGKFSGEVSMIVVIIARRRNDDEVIC